MLDYQLLFTLTVHLSVVAWTSPRAPSDAVLDVIATRGVRHISFSQYVRVSLLGTRTETPIYQGTPLAQY